MAPTTLCIVAFTVEIIPDNLSVATGPNHSIDRFRVRTKKRVSVASVSESSFYHQPYQCRRSHCNCHVYITRHAIEWPQPSAERWIPSSTRLSKWVLTISERRRGHAEQVRRCDPSKFQSDVGSRAFG